jgi:HEAT repeat protein
MNKLIIVFSVILMASSAQAQSRRSLKDIDRELKQTKSTATALALIESIAETVPQTDEDVAVLGQLMDKYPTQGQKALTKIKDPQRAKAVMKECDRQVAKFKTDKDKDWKSLPEVQRQEKLNALLNTYAMIVTLGNLKNKEALPFLKQYITPEYDGTVSYEASKAIGTIAPNDPDVFRELWGRQGIKNINYNAYGKSVLKEVAQKMQDPNASQDEKHRALVKSKVSLLSGKDPEEKILLKDIVLNHPDEDLRKEAGIAMLHSLANSNIPEDTDFVLKWTQNPKDPASGWAMYYIRDNFNLKFLPALLKYLKESEYGSTRANVAEILGRNKIKESLPYLAECAVKDRESNVRGACRGAYYDISGKMPSDFNPEDIKEFESDSLRKTEYYSKRKPEDQGRKYYEAYKKSVEEYRRIHK